MIINQKRFVAVLLTLCMMMSSLALLASAKDDAADENTLTVAYDDLVNQGLDPDALNNRLMGDYNNDRVITAEDARITLRTAVSLEKHLSKEQLFVIDVDQDTQITAADARSILRMSVGLDVICSITVEESAIELTFNYGEVEDDSLPKSQVVKKGTIPEEPELPELDDYVFLGWYADKDFNTGYFFADELNEDTEIFAKWTNRLKDEELQLDEELVASILDKQYADSKEGQEIISFEGSTIQEVKVDYKLKTGAADVYIAEANGLINHTFGMIGSAIDITMVGEDELETAEIVFTYNENELPENVSEEDLGIVWYDEENNKMVLLEDTKIDKENNTISYTTSHFSKYVVVNTKAWIENWAHKQLVNRIDGTSLRFNIVLCLDDSGSMEGRSSEVCVEAAKGFVDQLVDGDNIGIIKFSNSAKPLVEPTKISTWEKNVIKNKIKLSASGGTNFSDAVYASIEMLNKMPQKTENDEILKNYIVFLSDGKDNSGNLEASLEELVKYGFSVLAIGVGNDVSEADLREMADRSGGAYSYVADPNDITAAFQALQGENIGLSVDSDGDGIADLVETDGLIATNGYIYRTDPNNPDTDLDGFSDGYEMGKYNDENGLFEIISDPMTPTIKSDKALFSEPYISVYCALGNVRGTTIDQYKKVTCSVSVEIIDRGLTNDSLGDILYSTAENFQIEIYVDGQPMASYGDRTSNMGLTTFSFTEEYSIGNHTFTAIITADNADEVVVTKEFNPFDRWYADVHASLQYGENKICKDTTDVIREYDRMNKEETAKAEKSKKKAEETVYVIPFTYNTDTYPEGLTKALSEKISQVVVSYAEENAKKSLATTDGQIVLNYVISLLKKGDKRFDVSVGKTEYSVKIDDKDNTMGLFGYLTATNKKTKQEYLYSFVAKQSEIIKALNNFIEDCNVLYETSLEAAKKAVISDAEAVLGVDKLPKLFKDKATLKALDKVIEKSGKFGFKAVDLKNAYDYYTKAKDVIDKAKSTAKEPTTKSINSVMTAVNTLLTCCYSL